MDVIAGNLGRNTSWQVPDNSPFRLAYGTFSNPAQTDVIELASKGHGEVFLQDYSMRLANTSFLFSTGSQLCRL